jgi:hypothetical protein
MMIAFYDQQAKELLALGEITRHDARRPADQ